MSKKYEKTMRKRNEAFAKLSPEEKRVQIARDVLFQLDSGKLKAKHGQYLDANFEPSEREKDQEFAEVLEKKIERCDVCALGSLFVCSVMQVDKLKTHAGLNAHSSEIRDYLTPFFSEEQLLLIEDAFEGTILSQRSWRSSWSIPYLTCCAAQFYNRSTEGPKKKLQRIMRNIVHNDGTFDPLDTPDYRSRANRFIRAGAKI